MFFFLFDRHIDHRLRSKKCAYGEIIPKSMKIDFEVEKNR